jgi:hypothetical protein
MKHIQDLRFTIGGLIATGLIMASAAHAGVSPEETAKLKTTLTPMGSERAANADGSIPAWTGGYTTVPPGYQPGHPRIDPFAAERPLYSITAKNMDAYAAKLTEGSKAMLKRYPTYRIDVYPSHRTAAAPQWVYENTFKNATRAKTPNNGGTVEGAYGSYPFPIPKTGNEVMWNHVLRWRGEAMELALHATVLGSDGKPALAADMTNEANFPYNFKDGTPEKQQGEFWNIYQTMKGPSFRAGEILLIRDHLDVKDGRQAWQYLVGQRRVRRFPTLGYDTPNPVNSGVDLVDQAFGFNGFQDKYDWKLVGKKEMLIPYNLNGFFLKKEADVLKANHLNPDFVRWELHRVWVVEATLAQGKRHVQPKRMYYMDEDTWTVSLADNWDAQGNLWSVNMTLPLIVPEAPGVLTENFATFDLNKSSYSATLINGVTPQMKIVAPFPESNFTPESMAARGVR